jgi:TonB family protein
VILTPMTIADTPCNVPDKDVTVAQAATPAYPDSAKDLGLGPVTVYVQVTVNPDGSVDHAVIMQSSNNMAIDQAALRAARASSYSPKIVGCSASTGSIVIPINMVPGSRGDPPVSCATPNQAVTILKAISPVPPAATANLTGTVTVIVRVAVAPDASVKDVRIVQSSADAAIDHSALLAARLSTYAPQMLACVPVSGTYLFHAAFSPR